MMENETNFAANDANATEHAGSSKDNNEKMWAALAYVLFFIPLLKENKTPLVEFHTNQGLLFFIFAAAGYIVFSLIPIVGWILLPFFSIAVLIFFILGIMNALSSKMKRLPWFGHIDLLK